MACLIVRRACRISVYSSSGTEMEGAILKARSGMPLTFSAPRGGSLTRRSDPSPRQCGFSIRCFDPLGIIYIDVANLLVETWIPLSLILIGKATKAFYLARIELVLQMHPLLIYDVHPWAYCSLAPIDAIERYTQISSHPLHKTKKPGILSVDIHPLKLLMPVEPNIQDIGGTEKFSKRNTSGSSNFGTNSKLKRPMRS
uniref:Pre-mRNA-processing factor 19 n=1 Tax=Ananas comosus var. bracteatus TaxID=296719 RepID=A0A6V7QC18_ANACO|nr:unnamed protein product [Ananas comosus var. bracteatus]